VSSYLIVIISGKYKGKINAAFGVENGCLDLNYHVMRKGS